MRNFLTVAVLVMCAGVLNAGSVCAQDILWTKYYGRDGYDSQQRDRTVRMTEDGGYIIACNSEDTSTGTYPTYLIRTDSVGDTLWTRTYDVNPVQGITNTFDGGFVFIGRGAYGYTCLLKTDAVGDSLWCVLYPDWYSGHSIEETSDSGLILTGRYSAEDVLLAKTDDSGNVQWVKTFGGTEFNSGESVVETSDRGFILTGVGSHISTIKTDSLGDSIWSSTIWGGTGAQSFSVCESKVDLSYFVTGMDGSKRGFVAKIDSLGDTLWTRTFGTGAVADQGNSILATEDGGVILTGLQIPLDPDTNTMCVLRYNSKGDTVWTRRFVGNVDQVGQSIVRVSQTEYAITGNIDIIYDSLGRQEDIYLYKLFDKTPIIKHVSFDADTVHQNVAKPYASDFMGPPCIRDSSTRQL